MVKNSKTYDFQIQSFSQDEEYKGWKIIDFRNGYLTIFNPETEEIKRIKYL